MNTSKKETFEPNQEWPFTQYLTSKTGVKVKIEMPVVSTEFTTFSDAMREKENSEAVNLSIELFKMIKTIYLPLKK